MHSKQTIIFDDDASVTNKPQRKPTANRKMLVHYLQQLLRGETNNNAKTRRLRQIERGVLKNANGLT